MNRPSPELLRQAAWQVWDQVEHLLSGLTDDDWLRPTPCVGWSVRDVAAHLGHVEGMLVHQFPQPDPPADWDGSDLSPLDQVNNLGVESRRAWTIAEVVDEVTRAGEATRQLLARPDLDWDEEALTPIGPAPRWTAVEMRVNDLVIHLADMRNALGEPLQAASGAAADQVAVGRALRLTPWAWVKRARATEGETLHLQLSGAEGGEAWITVEQGRAVSREPAEKAAATISGSAYAYLLAVTGRHALVGPAGGLVVRGERGRRLLADYRLVG